MVEFIRFAILGLGTGGIFALLALGTVQIHRGSGVLNFAQGAVGMVAGYVFWDLRDNRGVDGYLAMGTGVVAAAILGLLIYLVIMRPLRDAPPLTKVIATLGVMVVLQSSALLIYGSDTRSIAPTIPANAWNIGGGVAIGVDRIILFSTAIVVAVALTMLYRFTQFGMATEASAENPLATAALGHSPDRLAALNWVLGSAVGGLAGVLVVQITGLNITLLVLLTIPSLAAALVGRLHSYMLTVLGALLIGVGQSLVTRYIDVSGLSSALPFIVIFVLVLLSGRALPTRGEASMGLPRVGTGRVSPVNIVLVGAVALILVWTVFSSNWVNGMINTLVIAFVALSVVVVTGYAGQVSLAQIALAGLGAYFTGRLVAASDWPLWAATLAGVFATIPVGLLLALPALRARGITLAVITLGMGLVLQTMLFENSDLTGGITGTQVGNPVIFGIDVNAIAYPERYATVVIVLLLITGVGVANLRSSRVGRRLLAVRSNERAAAALGINVVEAKLFAFGIGAAIAALGGILMAFRGPSIVYSDFGVFGSVNILMWAVIGGVGYILGAGIAGTLAAGGVGAYIFDLLGDGFSEYVPLVGGIVILLVVTRLPDGLAQPNIEAWDLVASKFGRNRFSQDLPDFPERALDRQGANGETSQSAENQLTVVPPRLLKVDNVAVRFGGVVALNNVSLEVRPGEVLGLIGPNGAGKTTLIDAITGFVPNVTGDMFLDGVSIGLRAPHQRARLGIVRSWQSVEMFTHMSVGESLRLACEPRDRRSYLMSMLRLRDEPFPDSALEVAEGFGFADKLETAVDELSFADRKLLGLARSMASSPSVLLLDEPAAGLDGEEVEALRHIIPRLAKDRGMAVLLVEHDVNLVMGVSDRVMVLDFGTKIAEGSPPEVSADPAVIAAYFGEPEHLVDANADSGSR
ncbi:branched-chain amino acid ABC transporter permease/ATP-binding protein [Rhodococcus wratislaviensis]|uniref:Putative ABC transporter ATP-binding protein n=1 Tax=Rhodococcus wratislaviensis NBRC 100605 TaxID=1219028 RepID=X0QD98_RHOWR|nr:branched-chain amino acid ABC transporter permease/ATP-binding protein [Rhodococcus wratislaviensis]GAF48881.1 putative ABC transporter ATP-binding protein [Rhodococcus wratislaviensis NBRC 100605]